MLANTGSRDERNPALGRQTRARKGAWRILLCLLLIAASARFAVRGIANAPFNDYSDFMTLFAASRAWASGSNPYEWQSLVRAAVAGGLSHIRADAPSVYPPTIFPLIAPICALPWRMAIATWAAVNLVAVIICIDVARRSGGWDVTSPRTIALAAIFLLLDPTSVAEAAGQTSLIACAGILTCLLFSGSKQIFAGLCLAAATCVKPQLGLPAAVVILLTGRYKVFMTTVLGCAAVSAVAIVRLGQPGPWIANWIQNLHIASVPGGVNDPSGANPFVYQLLNLQYPLHTFLNSTGVIKLIVVIVGACLALPLVSAGLRQRRPSPDQLLLAGLAEVIGLLVIYHRNYDGVVLILLIGWYLCAGVPRKQLAVFLVLTLLLAIPNGSGIQRLKDSDRIPVALRETFFWRSVLMPYQCWALLAVGIVAAVSVRWRCADGKTESQPIAE